MATTPSSASSQSFSLGKLQPGVEAIWQRWQAEKFASRLWEKDYTLWSAEPLPELADRLGWLTLPETMRGQLDDMTALAESAKAEGISHVVLLGMGGSSLAPEVFQRTFGNAPGYPELRVLDSTHPEAVRAVEAAVDLPRTLFLVSSKSGTTTETLSFFHYFWQRLSQTGSGEKTGAPGSRFVAITDPGTPLEKLASERSFRRVFSAPEDVGGRYSALTVFGLVPAALIGVDVRRLLERAGQMAGACSSPSIHEHSGLAENPGLALGAVLGAAARSGQDKLTLLASSSLDALPQWIEQLIAESTGKDGKGIIPVVGEPLGAPETYGTDRLFVRLCIRGEENAALESRTAALEAAGHPVVRINLSEKEDLGQEFFRWEVAVAAAGAVLGIHPFNQPDVQLAKKLAREAMAAKSGRAKGMGDERVRELSVERSEELKGMLGSWLQEAQAGDYLAIHAYIAPAMGTAAALQNLRAKLRDRLHLATTVGFGPRFLHSTGQLHKGGPKTGLFLQLVDEPATDLPVPEMTYSFGALIRAQAMGDFQALRQRGRRVLQVNMGNDVPAGLRGLLAALDG
ncbi:MAG: hypothetical protein O7E51_07190 [Acidobacteria bacterium]|nr:hypothetical protein [Acidobacteriota bacterium]